MAVVFMIRRMIITDAARQLNVSSIDLLLDSLDGAYTVEYLCDEGYCKAPISSLRLAYRDGYFYHGQDEFLPTRPGISKAQALKEAPSRLIKWRLQILWHSLYYRVREIAAVSGKMNSECASTQSMHEPALLDKSLVIQKSSSDLRKAESGSSKNESPKNVADARSLEFVIDEAGVMVNFKGTEFRLRARQINCLKVLYDRYLKFIKGEVANHILPQQTVLSVARVDPNVTDLIQVFRSRKDAFRLILKNYGRGHYGLNI